MPSDFTEGGTLGNPVLSAISRFGDSPAIPDDASRWKQ
jgi:hypothetical protein